MIDDVLQLFLKQSAILARPEESLQRNKFKQLLVRLHCIVISCSGLAVADFRIAHLGFKECSTAPRPITPYLQKRLLNKTVADIKGGFRHAEDFPVRLRENDRIATQQQNMTELIDSALPAFHVLICIPGKRGHNTPFSATQRCCYVHPEGLHCSNMASRLMQDSLCHLTPRACSASEHSCDRRCTSE